MGFRDLNTTVLRLPYLGLINGGFVFGAVVLTVTQRVRYQMATPYRHSIHLVVSHVFGTNRFRQFGAYVVLASRRVEGDYVRKSPKKVICGGNPQAGQRKRNTIIVAVVFKDFDAMVVMLLHRMGQMKPHKVRIKMKQSCIGSQQLY